MNKYVGIFKITLKKPSIWFCITRMLFYHSNDVKSALHVYNKKDFFFNPKHSLRQHYFILFFFKDSNVESVDLVVNHK